MSKPIKFYHSIYNLKTDMDAFYEDIACANLNDVTVKKILELKNFAKELNKKFNNEGFHKIKSIRYTKIMNEIRCTPKKFNIKKPIEKFLLFMFSVDPTFEAAIIFGESNTLKEAKAKLTNHYELYDPCLVRLEQIYIKHFVSQKKQEEIKEEIKRRVFK